MNFPASQIKVLIILHNHSLGKIFGIGLQLHYLITQNKSNHADDYRSDGSPQFMPAFLIMVMIKAETGYHTDKGQGQYCQNHIPF